MLRNAPHFMASGRCGTDPLETPFHSSPPPIGKTKVGTSGKRGDLGVSPRIPLILSPGPLGTREDESGRVGTSRPRRPLWLIDPAHPRLKSLGSSARTPAGYRNFQKLILFDGSPPQITLPEPIQFEEAHR